MSKQQENKKESTLKSDLAISVEFSRIMHAMKAPIATGNEREIRALAEKAIECLSRRTDDEIAPIERINQKLRDFGINYDINKVLQQHSNPKQQVEVVSKTGYEIGKKSFALSTAMIGAVEELHQRVRTLGEAILAIYNQGIKDGMDNLLIREIIDACLSSYYTKKAILAELPDELKDARGKHEHSSSRRGKNDDNNPLEDSEDHRSEAQITTEVSKSLHYADKPEDPEVEQALEERPVKDRMYIERLEKESKYRLEELNKKQEQIQVLNTKVNGYEDALTKFQSASDPSLQQISKPGKIRMFPFDFLLEIQYAAAYKQAVELEHDGSKVTNVTRITGLERR